MFTKGCRSRSRNPTKENVESHSATLQLSSARHLTHRRPARGNLPLRDTAKRVAQCPIAAQGGALNFIGFMSAAANTNTVSDVAAWHAMSASEVVERLATNPEK